MISSILAVALVLGGLIFFHELGHFVVARLFKVGVTTFSLGFGPKLAGIKRGQTLYKLSALPLGGYVQMVGQSSDEDMPEGFTEADSFSSRPAWQRMLIVAAGPMFNFLLAVLIYWGIFWAQGQTAMLPVVGNILENSPALSAGLEVGDRIVAIDGHDIQYWGDLVQSIEKSGGKTMDVTITRGETRRELAITPKVMTRRTIFGEEKQVPMLGIGADQRAVVHIPMGPVEALGAGAKQTWNVLMLTVQGIIKMIERVVPVKEIGGPIMIAQLVSQQAQEGLVNVLLMAALISVNLGFLNLLPIPVLDGGHILFFAIEAVTGKPLSERWQAITIRIGLALLLSLMLLAIYNDIIRIVDNGL